MQFKIGHGVSYGEDGVLAAKHAAFQQLHLNYIR
jgi:hypothetical protein